MNSRAQCFYEPVFNRFEPIQSGPAEQQVILRFKFWGKEDGTKGRNRDQMRKRAWGWERCFQGGWGGRGGEGEYHFGKTGL